ncbi:hypothetical protein [Kitasatospora sp. MBT63]|uniref:hypothetical protein n=1 Tax=Kitasatospora sp. MBT63 TaxID=1444768 RepID=UPI00053B0202|nr:hypothetical protein [Kitasatospora sp. MBT63]
MTRRTDASTITDDQLDQLYRDRDAFADRVDTLTAVARSNAAAHKAAVTDALRAEARADQAEARAADWRQAHRHQVGLLLEARKAEEAEARAAAAAEAAVARARALAADMRTWCAPYGAATEYADRLDAALNGTTS